MEPFDQGLFAWLNQRPEFQALNFASGPFFDGTNCNIWPGVISESARVPALAFDHAGGPPPGLTMSGGDGVQKARIQFTAIGDIYADPATLIGVLCGVPGTKSILHGFSGQFPNGVVIQLARQIIAPFGSYIVEARLYMRHVDFEFTYEI